MTTTKKKTQVKPVPPPPRKKPGSPKGRPSSIKGLRKPQRLKNSSQIVDWDTIRTFYVHGEMVKDLKGNWIREYKSLKKLADQFGISYFTVASRSTKERWSILHTEACKKEQAETSRRLIGEMAGQEAATRHQHFLLAGKLVTKLETMVDGMPDAFPFIDLVGKASNALRKNQETAMVALDRAKDGPVSIGDDWTLMRAARTAEPEDVSDLALLPLATLGGRP